MRICFPTSRRSVTTQDPTPQTVKTECEVTCQQDSLHEALATVGPHLQARHPSIRLMLCPICRGSPAPCLSLWLRAR